MRLGQSYEKAMPESTEPVILAVDLGTSGVKVALITIYGHVLGWGPSPSPSI